MRTHSQRNMWHCKQTKHYTTWDSNLWAVNLDLVDMLNMLTCWIPFPTCTLHINDQAICVRGLYLLQFFHAVTLFLLWCSTFVSHAFPSPHMQAYNGGG